MVPESIFFKMAESA